MGPYPSSKPGCGPTYYGWIRYVELSTSDHLNKYGGINHEKVIFAHGISCLGYGDHRPSSG
jgi:hypothetical protein